MYHGIILDLEFVDPTYAEKFKIFAKRKSRTEPWMLFGVEVTDETIEQVISEVQKNMKSDQSYYAHFYNDEELIVVFKEKTFRVKPHRSTWKSVLEFGKKLGIPEIQLTFWPNRFQDEIHDFNKEDFV